MNGDVLTDIDYGALLERHAAQRRRGDDRDEGAPDTGLAGRAALRRRRRPHASDGLRREAGDRLHGEHGRLLLRAAGASHIEPGERLDFPDLILRLIAAGEIVRAWPSEDYWLDIGRHDDYEQAQEEFESVRDRLMPPEPERL